MSTFPSGKRTEFLQWAEAHAPAWEQNAAAIGLSAGQAAAFTGRVEKLAAKHLAVEEARNAYMLAVENAKAAFREAKADAAALTQLIRARAGVSKNPVLVYRDAALLAPRKRRPAPPPARPMRLSAALGNAVGTLALSWKASNPPGTSGTSYVVRRRLPGEANFAFLGIADKKRFIDATLPPGVGSAEYTVQGVRAGKTGPTSAVLYVSLGVPKPQHSPGNRPPGEPMKRGTGASAWVKGAKQAVHLPVAATASAGPTAALVATRLASARRAGIKTAGPPGTGAPFSSG